MKSEDYIKILHENLHILHKIFILVSDLLSC